jgi:catechol 2,3-dioxygenase-like lactoylglutathione lyase family enzyme
MIENITPILRVDDLGRSRRFYCDVLGFKLDWDAGEMIQRVARPVRADVVRRRAGPEGDVGLDWR